MRELVDRLASQGVTARKTEGSFDREVALERTLAIAHSLRARYGITRIADTTYLDRIGIPTMSAIVPNSPDGLGVYNGKGLTRDAALAGALMEAIERQICARFEGMEIFDLPRSQVDAAVDLRALGWIGPTDEAMRVPCVRGINLLDGAEIPVPVGVARCPRVDARLFAVTSTNGLASGNTALEAVYHAVMELIERHLWSSVHILAHMWPRSLRARAGLAVEQPDDPIAMDVIDAAQHPVLADPIAKIVASGLRFRLLAYAPEGWPIGMMAIASEPVGDELYYHLGFGCSWSPVHAAIRAITEAAQARATEIQGAREDIKRAHDGTPVLPFEHGRRPDGFPSGGRWYFDGPAGRTTMAQLPDRSTPDLAADLRRALDALRAFGEKCVAYVDLTPPGVPIAVARVVAPHLERTLIDGSISGRMAGLLGNPLLRTP
jgi:ribosomal protein S12 methylthiotransferase accessory factor